MIVAPCLLVASPTIRDPHFARTVVLLWHHDDDGAIGVVVNRATEHLLPDVLDLPDGVDTDTYARTCVNWGGPVETSTGTLIAQQQVSEQEGWNVAGLGVSRSMDVLMGLLERGEPVMLCLGYAGWGPGQLEEEVRAGGWIFTDVDPDLVFEAPPEDRYPKALASLGLTEQVLWMPAIDE